MPITVLNDPHATWASAGQAAGAGISEAFEELTQARLERKRKKDLYEKDYNFWKALLPDESDDFIRGIANQSPEMQQQFLSVVQGARMNRAQQQQQQQPQQPVRNIWSDSAGWCGLFIVVVLFAFFVSKYSRGTAFNE